MTERIMNPWWSSPVAVNRLGDFKPFKDSLRGSVLLFGVEGKTLARIFETKLEIFNYRFLRWYQIQEILAGKSFIEVRSQIVFNHPLKPNSILSKENDLELWELEMNILFEGDYKSWRTS